MTTWKKTDCTIMIGEWTDKRRMIILNFLVNCPWGTFFLKSIGIYVISKATNKLCKMLDDTIEEIDEENIVQTVTKNVVNYKATSELLIKKRKETIESHVRHVTLT